MFTHRLKGIFLLHGVVAAAIVYLLFYGSYLLFVQNHLMTMGQVQLLNYNFGLALCSFFALNGLQRLYDQEFSGRKARAVKAASKQFAYIVIVMLGIIFFTKDQMISRAFILTFLGLCAVALVFINYSLPFYLPKLVFGSRRHLPMLVVGTPKAISQIQPWIESREFLGFDAIGAIVIKPYATASTKELSMPVLGSIQDLEATIQKSDVRKILIAESGAEVQPFVEKIMRVSIRNGCRLVIRDSFASSFQGGMISSRMDGEHLFHSFTEEPLENPVNAILKRAFDIAVSLPVVCFLLPPLVLWVAFMQRRESAGPIFYRQDRFGRDRSVFRIFKFRTMHVQNEDVESQQASKDDLRTFRFGKFLRRTSLDEIPQFLNVLLGDMSVVGPRPHLVAHDYQFANRIEDYWSRHFTKPGITGQAQICGFRGEITDESQLKSRIEHDLQYIRGWSVLRDIVIVARTAIQVIRPPENAY